MAIEVARQQSSRDVLRMLAGLMLRHGIPKQVKSHFQLKHAQARVGLSARHRELVDAKFVL